MNYNWLAPSLLEFFYSTATPNDYFIGAISGPGYMYPKSVPKAKLPGLIRRADSLMQRLDLRVFDIMNILLTGVCQSLPTSLVRLSRHILNTCPLPWDLSTVMYRPTHIIIRTADQ